MKYSDIYIDRTIAHEDRVIALLEAQLEHLDKEYEIRKDLSFKKTNPTFEYENDSVYLEHMKNSLKLNIDQEKIGILAQIDKVLNDRDVREAIEKEK